MTSEQFENLAKGLPITHDRRSLPSIGESGLDLLNDDLALPIAVLKQSALENNRRWMRKFIQSTGVNIAPHGKTSLSPDLFRMQIEDGAWGITAATAHHVRLYSKFGIKKILMANQLVGRANIEIVSDLLKKEPELDFYCLVDSPEGVSYLARHWGKLDNKFPLQVLIEIGAQGARTGARTIDKVSNIAKSCALHSEQISLHGLEIFEGVFAPGPNSYGKVDGLQTKMLEAAEQLDQAGYFQGETIILTAGGSVFFDMSVNIITQPRLSKPITPIIRSGCYITHDSKHYEAAFDHILERNSELKMSGRLKPALEVWAHIQSLPEPGMAIASLGKRDISYDVHMPTPLWAFRKGTDRSPRPFPGNAEVKSLYDQHAVMFLDTDHGLEVGDLVGFGLSHPCTTFDKWRNLLVVTDAYEVTGSIQTYF